MPALPPNRILSIQALRFIAAFIVVLQHIDERLLDFYHRYGISGPISRMDGNFGVDIFFVISGFVIGHLALEKFGQSGVAGKFLFARIAKVVPLYWALTFIIIAGLAIAGGSSLVKGATLDLVSCVKSLFFIPFADADHKHRPVLGGGWTLDYEMLFYGLMAICLPLRKFQASALLTAAILGLVLIGHLAAGNFVLSTWGDPIILQFLIGFYMALARDAWVRANKPLLPFRHHLAAHVLIVTIFTITGPHYYLPAAMALATLMVGLCAFTTDLDYRGPVARLFVRLGDSSYSLYLAHGAILLVWGIAWRSTFGGRGLLFYAAGGVILSLALSQLVYAYIERPGTLRLKSWGRSIADGGPV